MVSVGHISCNVFYTLIGFFAFVQQTDGNEVSMSTTATTTGKNETYFFYKLITYPRDCQEVLDQCTGRHSSGVFVIKPDGYPHPFEVYCNNSFDSGGWTVFTRRLDGSLVFSREWNEYKNGFGYLSSEFWLGNKKLAFLTNQKRYELRIDVIFANGSSSFLTYNYFHISDEWGNYAMVSVGNASGNTGPWAPICPTNMINTNCTCERTCEAPTICQNDCHEVGRCFCPNGFFLNGSDCVTPEECQCYSSSAGKVIPAGQSFINNQCSEACTCNGNGLTCNNYNCDNNARCTTSSGGGRCACDRGFVGNGIHCGCSAGYLVDGSICRRPRDCDEVPSVAGYNGSGLYYILPSTWRAFWVYCNMSGGRWTVFQRRIAGSGQDFYLSWNSYKTGFGELDEDFWLGNDKIHYLTSQRNYQLRIDIVDSGNRHFRAQYNGFRIGNEGNKYRITVLGSYIGNAGFDAMRHHLNQPFTTHDRDNDDYYYYYCYSYNCAIFHRGAWWYKYRDWTYSGACDRFACCYYNYHYSCPYSNLNGKANGNSGETIFWHGLSGNDCRIKYTEMKIRPL